MQVLLLLVGVVVSVVDGGGMINAGYKYEQETRPRKSSPRTL